MLGKLIVWALDWDGVVRKARRALDEFYIGGLPTNIPLHREIVRDPDFIDGKFDTGYLDKKMKHFNLEAIHHMAEEEQRHAELIGLVKMVRTNSVGLEY